MSEPKYIVTNANATDWQVLAGYPGVEVKNLGSGDTGYRR